MLHFLTEAIACAILDSGSAEGNHVPDKDLDEMQEQALGQLHWLREEGGLSLSEIGRRLNTPFSTVSRWANRHHRMTPRSCQDIARLYQAVREERGVSD